ncbi:polymorphic toxin type 50 domain-containing protein [Helicobacter bizzozeronii]|uniref:polymorphic toxin type 50 domain-containing protein n=1 Tax=Helicobacter bizzozeronii TaxID=56877 RepID=UPI000CF0A3D9|nr:polymorphic toxin type 50 domain-containing protein [Helicobacter bizzozeronii]
MQEAFKNFIEIAQGFNRLFNTVSAAALRHHLKAALNKSASVQDFKIQLKHLVQRADFDNATKALIREIEGGLPPDDELPKTKLDIEVLAKRQEGESEEQLKARVKKVVMDLSPILGLDNKQERHMWGQKGYIAGRSYYGKPFDVEQVKPLFKDGEMLWTKNNNWDKKIIITHPDFYGMCVPNGDMSKAIKTYKSKVHFGDDSFHLVPYAEKRD